MSERQAPDLVGLVLAGGESRRMLKDKGTLVYHGLPQAEHCYRLLAAHCREVFVSIRPDQSTSEPYCRLPQLTDAGAVAGPAAGLLSAWQAFPDAALLAFAVDLPLVDAGLLADLVGSRNPDRSATAWVHPDGVLEPLCAIWEPRVRPRLVEAAATRSPSLRRVLEAVDVERLEPPAPQRIVSVNTEEDYRVVLDSLTKV